MSLFYREAGSGPAVICLHANASTSGQWRGLMELLAPRWHVLAPDTLGAGRGPAWPALGGVRLADEVAALVPLLDTLPPRVHLVGHSYGAAIALKIALTWPDRVAGMVLYEPTLFALLFQQQSGHPAANGIADAVHAAGVAIDRDDTHGAAEIFIDYWMGTGAWAAMPPARRPAIAEATRNIRGWARALMQEPATLADIVRLPMPLDLIAGSQSPASAQAVWRLLAASLPRATVVELPGLGHMGPVTHPEAVNPAIAAQLDQVA